METVAQGPKRNLSMLVTVIIISNLNTLLLFFCIYLFPWQQLNTAFSTMDEYASQHLEFGGMPYTRFEIKGGKIPNISNEGIGENSDLSIRETMSLGGRNALFF